MNLYKMTATIDKEIIYSYVQAESEDEAIRLLSKWDIVYEVVEKIDTTKNI